MPQSGEMIRMKHIEAPFQEALKEYLFFFPHAGASVEVYQHWVPYFNSHIICQSIPLPGRGRRFLEPFCESLEDLIHDLIPEIPAFSTRALTEHRYVLNSANSNCVFK